jgi:hypothetical protein
MNGQQLSPIVQLQRINRFDVLDTGIARQGDARYAFYRGEKWLGAPKAQPKPKRPPEAHARPSGLPDETPHAEPYRPERQHNDVRPDSPRIITSVFCRRVRSSLPVQYSRMCSNHAFVHQYDEADHL